MTMLSWPIPSHRRRYLLRVTVTGKGMVPDTKRDFPFWVRNYEAPTNEPPPIKVGACYLWPLGAGVPWLVLVVDHYVSIVWYRSHANTLVPV